MVRPMRVFSRTSRTVSVPLAGRAVTGHFRTVASVHGAISAIRVQRPAPPRPTVLTALDAITCALVGGSWAPGPAA